MNRWLFIAFFISACWLLGNQNSILPDAKKTSLESTYQVSSFQQGWACLPLTETRTHNTVSFVYFPSLPFKGTTLSQIQGLEQSSFQLEQKEKALLVNHLIQLGLTDIQRIFPFHQFW